MVAVFIPNWNEFFRLFLLRQARIMFNMMVILGKREMRVYCSWATL